MKSPMRRTGLICARGSWNTIDIRFRYERSSPPLSVLTSCPPNRICPSTSAPGGSDPLTARAVIVLPEPDSPTSPTDSPGSTDRDTLRNTARLVPAT